MAERSKARVCGPSLDGIAGSNAARGMGVCVFLCRTVKDKIKSQDNEVWIKYKERTKKSQWKRVFPHRSRPAVGPTQPAVQGVAESFLWQGAVKRPGRGVNYPPPFSKGKGKGFPLQA